MATPHVKGLGILGVLAAMERLLGKETHAKIIARMPEELAAKVHTKTLLSAGWYPLADYCRLHAVAQSVSGRGPELARALSRDAVLQDFRGIYRVLTFMLSPQFLVKRAPGIFGRYFDIGKLEVPEAGHGHARALFSGCSGFDHSVWEDSIGGTMAILEACGARDIVATVKSGGRDGDEHLDVSATWK